MFVIEVEGAVVVISKSRRLGTRAAREAKEPLGGGAVSNQQQVTTSNQGGARSPEGATSIIPSCSLMTCSSHFSPIPCILRLTQYMTAAPRSCLDRQLHIKLCALYASSILPHPEHLHHPTPSLSPSARSSLPDAPLPKNRRCGPVLVRTYSRSRGPRYRPSPT